MARNILIIGLLLLMGSVTFLTWGSIGSAITGYGAVLLVFTLIKNHFLADNPYEDTCPPEESE